MYCLYLLNSHLCRVCNPFSPFWYPTSHSLNRDVVSTNRNAKEDGKNM